MKTIAILITTYFIVFTAGFSLGIYTMFSLQTPPIFASVNNGLRMIGMVNAPEPTLTLLAWFVALLPVLAFLMFIAGRYYEKRRKSEKNGGDTPKGGAL